MPVSSTRKLHPKTRMGLVARPIPQPSVQVQTLWLVKALQRKAHAVSNSRKNIARSAKQDVKADWVSLSLLGLLSCSDLQRDHAAHSQGQSKANRHHNGNMAEFGSLHVLC